MDPKNKDSSTVNTTVISLEFGSLFTQSQTVSTLGLLQAKL
jgi:hypothetical protein